MRLYFVCIIGIARHVHPQFPLIVAGNRDEFFARPTAPLSRWPGRAGIVAGQDLQAGGTWLGVNAQHRFAAITNFRDPAEHVPEAKSRGEIVAHALTTDATGDAFLATLRRARHDYRGFNFIWIDAAEAWVYESRFDRVTPLEDGVTIVSNGPLASAWPKCNRLKAAMMTALQAEDPLPAIDRALLDATRGSKASGLPSTGVSPEIERALSSVFVSGLKGYGTRSSSVFTQRAGDGRCMLRETTHAADTSSDVSKMREMLLECKVIKSNLAPRHGSFS